VRYLKQMLEIVESSVCGVNIAVVGNVIAVVYLRRGIYRGEPDAVYTKITKDGELGYNAGKVSDTVAVRVAKAFAVDLVYYGLLPPFLFHRGIPSLVFFD
jgi:hypothetical protein